MRIYILANTKFYGNFTALHKGEVIQYEQQIAATLKSVVARIPPISNIVTQPNFVVAS